MRPPSSGRIGSRFSTISTRLITDSDARHFGQTRRSRAAPPTGAQPSTQAHSSACTKFDPGPAAATQIMSRLGWRRLPKFTGTGFAQPNMNGRRPSSAAAARPGTSIVPIGSMCFIGFSVTRPSIQAVRSPNSLAT